MPYTLPDGRELDLERVIRVSKIRDEGIDSNSIEYSKLSFHIYLVDQEAIEVCLHYHYADWADRKKRLKQVRDDLLEALRDNDLKVDDT